MTKICSVPGCTSPHNAKGFCDKHYRKWRRHGDPLGVADRKETNKKIKIALTGKAKSKKHRDSLSKSALESYANGRINPRKGVTIPQKQKDSQSKKMKGTIPWMKGKKHKESSKQILREKATGRPSPRKGKHHTSEANEKNRQAHLGKKASDKTKKNMSIAQNQPETLRKNRERYAKQPPTIKDTTPEKLLQKLCENAGIKFETHKNFNLGFQGHKVDIFIEPNICLEADGDRTHANPHPFLTPSRTSTVQPGFKSDQIIYRKTAKSIREKDRRITAALILQGNHVLRFWHSELEQNPKKCIKKIIRLMSSSK